MPAKKCCICLDRPKDRQSKSQVIESRLTLNDAAGLQRQQERDAPSHDSLSRQIILHHFQTERVVKSQRQFNHHPMIISNNCIVVQPPDLLDKKQLPQEYQQYIAHREEPRADANIIVGQAASVP